jgi:hypothetical protein
MDEQQVRIDEAVIFERIGRLVMENSELRRRLAELTQALRETQAQQGPPMVSNGNGAQREAVPVAQSE